MAEHIKNREEVTNFKNMLMMMMTKVDAYTWRSRQASLESMERLEMFDKTNKQKPIVRSPPRGASGGGMMVWKGDATLKHAILTKMLYQAISETSREMLLLT